MRSEKTASAVAERGAGTVLVLTAMTLAVVLGIALVAIGFAHQAKLHAQSAADLAAIAAATAIQTGYEPCSVARELTTREGVTLAECRHEGSGIVVVEARLRVTSLPFRLGGEAKARARAGPAR